jgi:hypothetical protein
MILLPKCDCCTTCCCQGDEPLSTGANNRRIARYDERFFCDEAGGTHIPVQTGSCSEGTLIVEWCGLTVEMPYGQEFGSATNNNLFDPPEGPCEVVRRILTVADTSSRWTGRQGWQTECGRCVFRYDVSLVEQLTAASPCGQLPAPRRNYAVEWREGCDEDVQIDLVFTNERAFTYCDDVPPDCTVTLAP